MVQFYPGRCHIVKREDPGDEVDSCYSPQYSPIVCCNKKKQRWRLQGAFARLLYNCRQKLPLYANSSPSQKLKGGFLLGGKTSAMKYANAVCQIIGYVSTMWNECFQPTVIPLLWEGIFQQLKVREVSTFHGGRQLVFNLSISSMELW